MNMHLTWCWMWKCRWRNRWLRNNKKLLNLLRRCSTALSMLGKQGCTFDFRRLQKHISSHACSCVDSYILTNRGMHAMYEKYRVAAFGRCPHVFCQGQPVLPVGLSDLPRNYTVNVFCPRCHGLFFPKSTRQANIDGAYFGTTFPHLYLMTHPVSFFGNWSMFTLLCDVSSLGLLYVFLGNDSFQANAKLHTTCVWL